MEQIFTEISARIPANKFYPPRFAEPQTVFRPRLVDSLLGGRGRAKKVFVIEGQAGQGKTTLAAQFLQHSRAPYVWYQIGEEDRDPILLLTALVVSLKRSSVHFASPQLEEMLAGGQVNVLEMRQALNILLSDLADSLSQDFYLVLDDLHLLDGFEQSLALIDYMIETAPPQLRFILLSRWRLALKAKPVRFSHQTLQLGNRDLAMSEEEASILLQKLLDAPLPPQQVRAIHQATDGWIMGLVMASHLVDHEEALNRLAMGDGSLQQGTIPEYFKEEILVQIPPEVRRPLLKLALLEEIPVALAEQYCEGCDIRRHLVGLMEHNFFVRSLDEDNTLFVFHHLFREFLVERAKQELAPEELRTVYALAAAHWLATGQPEKALAYALQAEDYQTLEQVLAEHGMALLAINRVVTLSNVVRRIPEAIIKESGWFSYFFGVATMLKDPKVSLPFFEIARINFIKEENLVGELLASAELINFHMAFDGSYNQGVVYLRRAEELFQLTAPDLDTYSTILVAHDIASGFCFFEMDMEKSDHYSSLGLELARKKGLDNFVGRIRIIQGFAQLLQGRYQHSRKVAELAYPLIWNPRVDVVSRIGLRTLLLDILEKSGEFDLFAALQEESRSSLEGSLISGTITGPLLTIWNADQALANGQLDRAEEVIRQGLASDFYAEAPHLRSQFLQYQAYIHALRGQRNEAVDALEEARNLRAVVGGPYYLVLNDLLSTAVFVRLGMATQAKVYLARTLEGAARIGSEYFQACGLWQQALLAQAAGDDQQVHAALSDGVAILRRQGYRHFHGWEPESARQLLQRAVAKGIEPEYARQLAADRLGIGILADGAVCPILEIRVSGGLAVGIAGGPLMKAEEFTPSQRALLALLVSAPDLRMSQEQIQLALWPDSPPDKARSTFDSLLSRLRKNLGQRFGKHAKRWLALKKGIVCLEHCRIDCLDFLRFGRAGLVHVRSREYWQAGNNFQRALALWRGCFLETMADHDQVYALCSELRGMARDVALAWSGLLAELNRLPEAVGVVERVLMYDLTNEELVARLYQLHLTRKDSKKAEAVLRSFELILRRNEYLAEEIQDILQEIRHSSLPG